MINNIQEQLEETLQMIDLQISELKLMAQRMGCQVYEVRSPNGDFPLAPLLAAKAQILLALSQGPNSEHISNVYGS
jgi:hypothetical protein